VLITAVDALTGEAVVFDRRSGVDLVDAVAASTGRETSANGVTWTPLMLSWRARFSSTYREPPRNSYSIGSRGPRASASSCPRRTALTPAGPSARMKRKDMCHGWSVRDFQR
jgi:hypothetical protein